MKRIKLNKLIFGKESELTSINVTGGNIFYAVDSDKTFIIGGTTVEEIGSSGGGGTPAGADTQIQYNDSGSFGASSNFTYDSGYMQIINPTADAYIYLENSDSGDYTDLKSGYVEVADNAGDNLVYIDIDGVTVVGSSNNGKIVAPTSGGSSEYNLPSASGTLALTSQLSDPTGNPDRITFYDGSGDLSDSHLLLYDGTTFQIGQTGGAPSQQVRLIPGQVNINANGGGNLNLLPGAIEFSDNSNTMSLEIVPTGDNTLTLPQSTGTVATEEWVDANKGKEIGIACSDETSDLVVADDVTTFRMPYAMTLTEVRANVNTAPTDAKIEVDVLLNGTSVLSTALTIDADEKTSTTAAIPAVISTSALTDDAEITINIDQIGSTAAGKGLKLWLIGTKA